MNRGFPRHLSPDPWRGKENVIGVRWSDRFTAVAPDRRCPIDGTPLQRGERGPWPTYCSHACRQKAYEQRHRYPLGAVTLATWGIDDVSLLSMLTAGRSDRQA